MLRVLGWEEDYKKYIVGKEIMGGRELHDKMRKLHDKQNASRKIKPLAKELDKYKE